MTRIGRSYHMKQEENRKYTLTVEYTLSFSPETIGIKLSPNITEGEKRAILARRGLEELTKFIKEQIRKRPRVTAVFDDFKGGSHVSVEWE